MFDCVETKLSSNYLNNCSTDFSFAYSFVFLMHLFFLFKLSLHMASKWHMKFAEASVKNICLDVSPISLCQWLVNIWNFSRC